MTNSVTRLDLSFLSSSNDPTAKSIVSECIRNDFLLCEEMGKYSEQLVLLDGNPSRLLSPQILWGGSQSLASAQFNFDWPRTPVSPRSVFSETYRQIVAGGYCDCINQTSVIIEHIECDDTVLVGRLPVSYVRALIPITNGQGAWFIGVYSFKPSPGRYPKASSKAEQFRQACIPGSTNLHMPCSPAVFPR